MENCIISVFFKAASTAAFLCLLIFASSHFGIGNFVDFPRQSAKLGARHAIKLQTIICTTCLAKSEEFYRKTLGLKMKPGSERALIFDVGGSDLRVSPVPSMIPSEHTVIGFSVSDVIRTVASLSKQGLTFERFNNFPHDPDGILTTPDGSKVAWLRDPDGNLLSIVQFSQI